MKKITFLAILLLFSTSSFSQVNLSIPKDYKLENAEDYKPLENDVLNAIKWLSETKINEQTEKRIEVNAFLLKWLMGSPYVHIEINPEIVTFIGTAPELLLMFMGGWAKYSIEAEDYNNKTAGSLAGIEMVINFYEKNKSFLPKDKNVESYIKMKKKGKLKEYVEKNA